MSNRQFSILVSDDATSSENEWDVLWKFCIPPRIKSLFWRLCRGFIVVKENINMWYPGSGSICLVCNKAGMTETIWHLFVDCNFGRTCWSQAGLWRGIDELCYQVDSPQELFKKILASFSKENCEKVMTTTWAIWPCRNSVVWADKFFTPTEVTYMVAWALKEWKEVQQPLLKPRQTSACQQWHKPPRGFLKMNVDASFFADELQTGVSMFIRNKEVDHVSSRILIHEWLLRIEEGEVWGVLEAIQWAIELGLCNLIIEMDAQMVRDTFRAAALDDFVFGDFVKVGKDLLKENPGYCIKCVCCKANVLAHTFARAACRFESPHSWFEPPRFVDNLLDWCTSCT